MSDTTPTPDATPSSDSRRCGRGDARHRRRWGRRFAFLGLIALGVFALPRAFGWGGGHCGHHGAMSAEDLRGRMSWMSDRALDHVDATDQQYAEVEAILDQAAPKLAGLHEEGRDLRQRFRQAVIEHPEDREALHALRKEGIALADRASAAALDDLSRVAAVLTPEQRQELAKRWAGRWGHGEDAAE